MFDYIFSLSIGAIAIGEPWPPGQSTSSHLDPVLSFSIFLYRACAGRPLDHPTPPASTARCPLPLKLSPGHAVVLPRWKLRDAQHSTLRSTQTLGLPLLICVLCCINNIILFLHIKECRHILGTGKSIFDSKCSKQENSLSYRSSIELKVKLQNLRSLCYITY